MTSKFNVGDKVEVINVDGIDYGNRHYYNGMVTKVSKVIGDDVFLLNKDGDEGVYIAKGEYDCLKLVEPKLTKNQRIAKLEEEVAELKLIVAQIRKPSTEVSEALSATTVEDIPFFSIPEPKSPNQLRAEIIEKAKGFVEEKTGELQVFFSDNIFVACELLRDIKGEFFTKKKSEYQFEEGKVTNKHIGRAIALGRALGLDVSEFEQAVLPNEVVVGHVATHKDSERNYTITDIDGDTYYTEPGSHYHKESFTDGSAYIINDTNAQYGGVE